MVLQGDITPAAHTGTSLGAEHPAEPGRRAPSQKPHTETSTPTLRAKTRPRARALAAPAGWAPPRHLRAPHAPPESSGSPQLLPQLCPREPRAEPGGGKLKFVALALLQCLLVNTTALRSTYFIFMELCPRPEPSAWVRSIQPGLCSIQTHPLPTTALHPVFLGPFKAQLRVPSPPAASDTCSPPSPSPS